MYELLKYDNKFQNMVLDWRNKDGIRAISKNNNIITDAEHNKRFKKNRMKLGAKQ